MSFSEISIWPTFAIFGSLMLMASAIVRLTPFYARELTGSEHVSRTISIDGLRGFLAFGVCFHHAVMTHFYHLTGVWNKTPPGFYFHIGHFGVGVFFTITAFLFTSKAINGPIQPEVFFRGRVKRLLPMYLATVLCVFLIVAFATRFSLNVRLGSLGYQLLTWLSFGFLEGADINGLHDTLIINSVFWSLACEWLFYALLPVMATFARGRWFWLMLAVVLVYGVVMEGHRMPIYFVGGAIAAKVVASGKLRHYIDGHAGALVSLAALAATFIFFGSGYGRPQAVLVLVFFLPIAHGNTLFGLLRMPSVQFLGLISYSTYLLHSMVLYVAFAAVARSVPVQQMGPAYFWVVVGVCSLIVAAASAVTYRFIEHPFLGKNFRVTASWLKQSLRRNAPAI